MSLNIKVDHVRKSKVFHGGDQISGFVLATGPINDNVVVVTVKFKGKSQTLIKRSNGQTTLRYADKVKFFRVVKVVYQGACNVEKGSSISWPFTFQLPERTEPDGGNPNIIYSRNMSALFAKETHPLPPSISVSGSKKGSQYKAFISYELHAELQRSARFSSTLRRSGNLPVVLCRLGSDDDTPDSQMTIRQKYFDHATSRLLPDHAQQARSLREWASDTFTSKAPRVVFSLSATCPMTLIEGEVIPIELCLVVDSAKSTVACPPEFRLIAANYIFKEYTHVRARTFVKSRDMTVKPSKVVLSRHLLSMMTPAISLKSNEAVDIGEIHNVSLANRELLPSFNSYSICRTYGAKLIVRIECAEKIFFAEFRWKPIVLPPKSEPLPESGQEDSVDGLGKVSAMGVVDFGDVAELGGGIVQAVLEGLSAFN